MKASNDSHILTIGFLGGIFAVIILILGTFWTGRSASKDTDSAVRNVSLFYLDELAERREQVVSSTINDYIKDLDVALRLIDKSDLETVENLQAYQLKMKLLYGLEKFAFVDNDGLIYTSRGTRNDIDKYSFDYLNLEETQVSIKNLSGNDKKIVISTPVDNMPFNGKYLVACFMEMDMDSMLSSVSLQSDNNSTTFCNIYTKSGETLTNTVLGRLASERNILDALKNASFEKGYSLEKISEDFAIGREGVSSFTYNDIRETIYYVPVRESDWMLTYLIRESVITDQISNITDGIIVRNLVLSIATALMLIAMFVYIYMQTKRMAKVTLEKQVSDAEARVKQQELEEQVAMQEELLEQEKKRVQQDNMITALSSDYRSVFYINLDTGESMCYRRDANIDKDFVEGASFNFSAKFREYAALYVAENYRKEFLEFIEPSNIRKGLEGEVIISLRYLTIRDGQEKYEMLRMAGVQHPDDRGERVIHAIGAGFTDIDGQMRDSMARSAALSDALAAAEEASKAKTIFLSNMSHEIRTPMNAIIGLDSLALHEPDISAKTREYLEKIGSSAQHLLGLINDILDMSRIESGRMVLKNEEFSFSKMIEQINTIFSGQCQDKGLSYSCRINGNIEDYYIGDDMKLRQVLINILGNAVKFTPAGGSVNFIAEKTAGFDGKSTLKFTIRDTGVGMSKEFLPKIFETFSQEDSIAVGKYGSSGLGMAISKSIVDMMNGSIDVESEKGVGTAFFVSVTLMDSDRKDSIDEVDDDFNPKDMVVLVIDDDPIACDHAKIVLEKIGICAETALSGQEAVEMVKLRHARRSPYNLIIVDWQMPEMDGVETTRRIREAIGDESAIIILTAYNWDDIVGEAKDAGVDSFIAKPLFSGSLLDEFKKTIKKKKFEQKKSERHADLTGKRILLAEDMEINAEIMVSVLEMKEVITEIAENGKIAVELFEKSPAGYYDAILMDMRMPEMNGLEATAAIRKLDREDAKKVPIIALTANAFDEDVQKSLQAGMNAHLSKPVDPDVLFNTLEKMI